MKALIVVKSNDVEWLRTVLNDRSPLLASVCNKPLLEFMMDFAILCGIRHVRIATDTALADVEAEFGNGSRWGIELTYSSIRQSDDLSRILLKNSGYQNGSRLLVMDGCFFLHYDLNQEYERFMASVAPGELMGCTTGRLMIIDNCWDGSSSGTDQKPPLALTPVRSFKDLHSLSLKVIRDNAHQYALPGYNSENDVFMGRNVVISRSAVIKPPVMIGDHVRIGSNAVVGPDAVLGRNVIVDSHTRIQESVILENTFVGEHLMITRKLAGGSRLMCPLTDTVLNLEDAHLLSGTQSMARIKNRFRIMGHRLLAALLWAVLAAPFWLLSAILRLQGRWVRTEKTFWADSEGRKIRFAWIRIQPDGICGRLAAALALDRFPQLARVMHGDLALIGSRPLPATEVNQTIVRADAGYRPGLFSYAESESWPVPAPDQTIVNGFHMARATLGYDLVMVVKIFLNKLHGEEIQ